MRALTANYSREQKTIMTAVIVSFVAHIVFFVAFVILPDFWQGPSRNLNNAITVMLVGGGGGPDPMPVVTTPAPSGQTMATVTPPPAEVKTPSQYAVTAEDDKKKTVEVDAEKVIESRTVKPKDATKKVEENLKVPPQQTTTPPKPDDTKTGTESVTDAIAALKAKQAAAEKAGSGSGTGGGTGTGVGTGTGPGSGTGTATGPLAEYLSIAKALIQKNWAFSETMYSGSPNLEVVIKATIMPDGKLMDVSFAKRSGNTYLDESAYRAVMKTDPLPAFTSTRLKRENISVTFTFTPKGIR